MDLKSYLDKNKRFIDKRLDGYLPKETVHPRVVHSAMRYMVMGPGKRFRPILVLEACRASGGRALDAIPAACAIEVIHTYSLIHDDLPSMDDADTRRGRQSCHRKFGEANAILTGDALLSMAFYLIGKIRSPRLTQAVLLEVSRAIGSFGMVGGQVADIESKNNYSFHLFRGNGNILLIEDEESVRIATSQLLEKMGYTITVCADGKRSESTKT